MRHRRLLITMCCSALIAMILLSIGLWGLRFMFSSASFPTGSRRERFKEGGPGGVFIGANPRMSLDSKFIVFSSPKTGRGDIYRINSDGTDLLQLTDDPSYEGDPTWLPSGKQIAFMRETAGMANIWVMNVDGTAQSRLTTGTTYDSQPNFSADGRYMTFCREILKPSRLPEEIYVFDTNTSQFQRITNNNVPDFLPSFSPDGKMLVISRYDKVVLVDLATYQEKELVSGFLPSFSPDGSGILYVAKNGSITQLDLARYDLASGQSSWITQRRSRFNSPFFTPDGQRIMFLHDPLRGGRGVLTFFELESETYEAVFDIGILEKTLSSGG